MSRVVLTGAAGRLGSVVTQHLLGAGHQVVALDRSTRPSHVPAHPRLEWAVLDLTDAAPLRPAVEEADGVIHLAAIPNPVGTGALELFSHNTRATFAVLEACAAASVPRVVAASSGSALGMAWAPVDVSPVYAPVDEDHPLRPADPYALSKQVDEATAAMHHRASGLPVVVLRLPWTAPPEAVATRVRELAADPGAGRRTLWTYLDVRDAATAVEAALGTETGFAVVGVAARDTLSDVPTEELVARYHPTTRLVRPIPGTDSVWDTSKAERVLGWRAHHSWRTDGRTGTPADPRAERRDPT